MPITRKGLGRHRFGRHGDCDGYLVMGQNLWLHFGVDEHPFATYLDVHQGYRVLTHSHLPRKQPQKNGIVFAIG